MPRLVVEFLYVFFHDKLNTARRELFTLWRLQGKTFFNLMIKDRRVEQLKVQSTCLFWFITKNLAEINLNSVETRLTPCYDILVQNSQEYIIMQINMAITGIISTSLKTTLKKLLLVLLVILFVVCAHWVIAVLNTHFHGDNSL
ncbi:CLUMA_CG004606, isoform A [Clunio marinus]|uniref:CLUMA_CG004606, isoform A n=1 Tax=Clunio marinus TaxID=568069 RepID=A0A1J1HSD4_9DIPT|nr:CLUMA_CG004606, isoform A [Clunio marinus]